MNPRRFTASITFLTVLLAMTLPAHAANYAVQFDGQNDYIDCGVCDELREVQET